MGAGIKTMQQRNPPPPPQIRDGGGVVGCNPKPSRLRLSIVACHFDLALFLINPVSFPAVGYHSLLQRAEFGNEFGSRETMRC